MRHREGSVKSGLKTQDDGFSLLEMMVAIIILLAVAGIVMTAMMQMTATQGSIGNRTEMHGSVRSATEVLQQEIGQAGRLPALPSLVTLSTAVAAGSSVTATVNSVSGMFNNEQLVVDAGQFGSGLPATYQNPETVTISNINSTANTFQATFAYAHIAGAPVVVAGAFPSGIIPTDATNPSTGSDLKMFGDINGDGNMVYVEYICDTAGGNLELCGDFAHALNQDRWDL